MTQPMTRAWSAATSMEVVYGPVVVDEDWVEEIDESEILPTEYELWRAKMAEMDRRVEEENEKDRQEREYRLQTELQD